MEKTTGIDLSTGARVYLPRRDAYGTIVGANPQFAALMRDVRIDGAPVVAAIALVDIYSGKFGVNFRGDSALDAAVAAVHLNSRTEPDNRQDDFTPDEDGTHAPGVDSECAVCTPEPRHWITEDGLHACGAPVLSDSHGTQSASRVTCDDCRSANARVAFNGMIRSEPIFVLACAHVGRDLGPNWTLAQRREAIHSLARLVGAGCATDAVKP